MSVSARVGKHLLTTNSFCYILRLGTASHPAVTLLDVVTSPHPLQMSPIFIE